MVFLEPVGDGKRAVRLEEFRRSGKEFGQVLIVGDGLDGPQEIELSLEIHGFGVHQKEGRIEVFFLRGLFSHFDLNWRGGDAGDSGMEFLGEVETAGAKATADVQDIRVWLDVCKCGEMFDELKLCLFLRFIPSDPITVMQMLAPDGSVERSKDVVVLDDFLFVVGTRHLTGALSGHGQASNRNCT